MFKKYPASILVPKKMHPHDHWEKNFTHIQRAEKKYVTWSA